MQVWEQVHFHWNMSITPLKIKTCKGCRFKKYNDICIRCCVIYNLGCFQYHITVIYLVDVNLSSLQRLNLGLIPRTYLWNWQCIMTWHVYSRVGFLRPLQARSSADDPTQNIKHYVCQLIDTVSQRLAFLQSAALLFPQGAQMLALLLPPSHLFAPDNICTAVLSAATHRREHHN